MYTRRPQGCVLTRHYRDRCKERGIPPSVADVAVRHGDQLPGLHPEQTVYRLSRLAIHRAARRGLALWSYENIAVVVGSGRIAVTAYHMTEEAARRRLYAHTLLASGVRRHRQPATVGHPR